MLMTWLRNQLSTGCGIISNAKIAKELPAVISNIDNANRERSHRGYVM